ncbi:LysR family transcriptional regulator [Francisella philomiragia]|uniref:LysR family transcriptional regulator n=1 Tax=Francisella philomiragia TaxID=28110 RepID=UPI003514983A
MSLETLDKTIIEATRYFVSVVELGTLTAVKDLYRIEINTLKTKIKQLEDYIGINLLVNNKNRITITENGMVFYQKCNKILYDLESTIVNVRDRGVNFRESLNIIGTSNFIDIFISHILPRLGEYKDKYAFKFDSYFLSQYQYINELDNYDIAIINYEYIDRIDQNKWIVCSSIEYNDENVSRVYASNTFLGKNKLSSLEEILEAPFILRKDNLENTKICYDKGGVQKNDIFLKNIKFVVENNKTKVRLIREGFGLGILDDFVSLVSNLDDMNISPVEGVYSKARLTSQYLIVSKYLPRELISKIRECVKLLLDK